MRVLRLEFQERMIMEKGQLVSMMKEGYVRLMHTSSTRICKRTPGWLETKMVVMSMIDLVLGKKDMLHYLQDVRGMGRGLSDHHFVLRKVKLMSTWIQRREVVKEDRRIRSEKLREHHYIIVWGMYHISAG